MAYRAAANGTRAGKMMVHMAAHRARLADHRIRQIGRMRSGGVVDHRKRRLERMREVARMGARLLRLPLRMLKQHVQLLHQRLHFQRQRIGHAVGTGGADMLDRALDAPQRAQADIALQQHQHHEAQPQDHEADDEDALDTVDLFVDLVPRLRDCEGPQGIAARQGGIALRNAERAAVELRAVVIEHVGPVGPAQLQRLVPQRARGKNRLVLQADRLARGADLVIEAGIGLEEALVAHRADQPDLIALLDLGRGDQCGQVVVELRVEILLDQVGQRAVQRQPATQQQHHDPNRRNGDHPPCQAAGMRGDEIARALVMHFPRHPVGRTRIAPARAVRADGPRIAGCVGRGLRPGGRRRGRRGCNQGHGSL